MLLRAKIEDWKKHPNALGSESQAAVIVGEVAAALNQDIPADVAAALKTLALRGTMRDIAQALQLGHEVRPAVPSFHDVVDVGAAAAGLSWTEAIASMTRYLDTASQQLS